MQNYLRAQAKLETAWKQVSNQFLVGIIPHIWFSLLSTKNIFLWQLQIKSNIYQDLESRLGTTLITEATMLQRWFHLKNVFAKSSSLPLFASNLVFQGGNPQSLSLLCCFLMCPWQVKSTLSRTLFLRIFILGEIVWPSSLALFMIVFIRIFVQGNCSTQLSGGSLAQLVIVRGLAGLDSTCARFSTIHIFCSGCKRTGPLKTNFQFFLLLLQLH